MKVYTFTLRSPHCDINVTQHSDLTQGFKNNSCSTQLVMKFLLLISVEMSTIASMSTFMSRINYYSIAGLSEPEK